MVEILKQPQYRPVPVERQVVAIWIATSGYLDELPVDDAKRFVEEFVDQLASRSDVLETIRDSGDLPEDAEATLKQTIEDFRQVFAPTETGPGSAAAAGVGSARDALREDVGWDRLSSEGDDDEDGDRREPRKPETVEEAEPDAGLPDEEVGPVEPPGPMG